jgi:PAS domain S-box-containing protein
MNRKMERPIFIRDTDPLIQGSTLVVGIDKKGNITRFNDTLEQLTGSSKKDVLDVPFSSYFSRQIPEEELQKLVNQARFNPESVDMDTSFQTVHGENVVVSWTGFAIKNEEDGRVSQLNLVGRPQKAVFSAQSKKSKDKKSQKSSKNSKLEKKTKQSSKREDKTEDNINNQKTSDSKDSSHSSNVSKPESETSDKSKLKTGKKSEKDNESKESLTSKKSEDSPKTDPPSKTKSKKKKRIRLKQKSKRQKRQKESLSEQVTEVDETETETTAEETDQPEGQEKKLSLKFKKHDSKPKVKKKKEKGSSRLSLLSKSDSSSQSTQTLDTEVNDGKTVKSLQKTIKNLEKENKQLQKENSKLEKNFLSAKVKREDIKSFFNSKFRFIRDSVAIRKKRDEFQQMMQQLSERKEKLEKLETDMVLEKKEFKQKIEEFITWREKLEKLEAEIEKRRQFLSEQESFLNEQYDKVLSHELEQPALYSQQTDKEVPEPEENPGILEKDDLFNSLTVEAAVLQRGRIKKANKRFAELLGYSEDELVGKHLVDFVGPTGLSGVEQHYMNRLKGVDDASYHTVFLSKNENEIPVKVHVKNGDFQGERAEIATFNEI